MVEVAKCSQQRGDAQTQKHAGAASICHCRCPHSCTSVIPQCASNSSMAMLMQRHKKPRGWALKLLIKFLIETCLEQTHDRVGACSHTCCCVGKSNGDIGMSNDKLALERDSHAGPLLQHTSTKMMLNALLLHLPGGASATVSSCLKTDS